MHWPLSSCTYMKCSMHIQINGKKTKIHDQRSFSLSSTTPKSQALEPRNADGNWRYIDIYDPFSGCSPQSCCRFLGYAQASWAGRRWSLSSPPSPWGLRGLAPGEGSYPGMLPRPCGLPPVPSASSPRRTPRRWTWWALRSQCTPTTPWHRPYLSTREYVRCVPCACARGGRTMGRWCQLAKTGLSSTLWDSWASLLGFERRSPPRFI